MAELLDLILASPATWGFAGAFIYAAPRWMACVFPEKGLVLRCSADALISLAIGTIAAAAFSRWALNFLHQAPADLPAVAAMIGLLANPVAPRLVDGLSATVANALTSKAGKLFKGDDK